MTRYTDWPLVIAGLWPYRHRDTLTRDAIRYAIRQARA